jgi:hypothetical protein
MRPIEWFCGDSEAVGYDRAVFWRRIDVPDAYGLYGSGLA